MYEILQKARDKGILNKSRTAMLISLIETGDVTCKICGKRINELKEVSCDHIIPISKGGKKWDIKNFQLAHKKCNYKKGNKLL